MLNRHKTFVFVGITVLGVVLTLVMSIIGTRLNFIDYSSISADQFANYDIVKANLKTNPASNGVPSHTIDFEFGSKTGGDVSADNNGFDAIAFAIQNANRKSPTIFNVHGSGKLHTGNAEFLFESLSPTDYESGVYRQAYAPFTQMANYSGFDSTKLLSTVSSTGERHVVVQNTSATDNLPAINAVDLWQQMLKAVTPVSANTSYELSLTFKDKVTLHAKFSTDTELKGITAYDLTGLLDSTMGLSGYDGVKGIDVYLQGQRAADNTVAVTVTKQDHLPDYLNKMMDYAKNPANKFPRNYPTTVTMENGLTPAYVFSPGKY